MMETKVDFKQTIKITIDWYIHYFKRKNMSIFTESIKKISDYGKKNKIQK